MTSLTGPAQLLRSWGLPAIVAAMLVSMVWIGTTGFTVEARTTLIVFALAITAWTLSPADDLVIAALAVTALIIAGVTGTEELARLVQHDLIWLLASAYIIAASIRKTSLMDRLALRMTRTSQSLEALFYRLMLLIAAMAFIIPAPSARAAMLLPVFFALSDSLASSRVTRALSLLFPSVILVSSAGVLTGAGAHLITIDILATTPDAPKIGYLQWLYLMFPVALISSAAVTWLILRNLTPEERHQRPSLPQVSGKLHIRERAILAVIAITILAWATNGLHGLGLAPVGIAAALVTAHLSGRGLAPTSLARAVEWKLLFFLAATMLLGEALVTSGAANAIAQFFVANFPASAFQAPWLIAALVSLIALLSHLVILSRSARAAILIPVIALPLAAYGYSITAITLLIAAGTGFCQTTRISAKPMMIFSNTDRPTFSDRDLIKLSTQLLPILWLLLCGFALFVWPVLGVPLATQITGE